MKVSLIASAPQPAPKAATALTPANKSKTAEAEVATSTAAAFSLSSTLRSVSEAKEEEWELIPLPPPDLGEVTYTLARDVVRTDSTSKNYTLSGTPRLPLLLPFLGQIQHKPVGIHQK